MNNTSKGYSIILFLIWPFSVIPIGIKNFDSSFGRKLLISAFVFLGFTASETGDIERYVSNYYNVSDNKLNDLLDLFINLQIGKFFTDFTAILFSVFDSHHIYLAFLFGFYAYFLVNSINLLRLKILKRSNLYTRLGFVTFALFFSVLTVFNYAFYVGAIYFLYFLLKIILYKKNKKYYLLIFLTPLFHIGLLPLLLVPLFYILFKQRTYLYILILIVFTILSQSFLIQSIDSKLSGTENVLQSKFEDYGSEEGKERLDTRYSDAYSNNNSNYRIIKDIRTIANSVAIPLLLFVLFVNRKQLITDGKLFDLFNLSIACLAITHLMLNISQGERFYFISGFMVLGTYVYYIQKFDFRKLKLMKFLYIIIPFLLLNNLVSLIIIKYLINSNFLLSNFPYLIFQRLL